MKRRSRQKHTSIAWQGIFALPAFGFANDEFLKMISENQKTIFMVCLHFTNREHENVLDLFQEIVRTLWEAWPNYRSDSSTKTWVRRIAINVAVQERRRRAKRPQFIPLSEWMYEAISEESEAPSTDYYRIISALDPDERELIYLRLDKLSLREIAEMLSTTEDAIKQRFRRLRQKIDTLKQHENEY